MAYICKGIPPLLLLMRFLPYFSLLKGFLREFFHIQTKGLRVEGVAVLGKFVILFYLRKIDFTSQM